MNEADMLKYIFKDDLGLYSVDSRRVYRMCVGKNYFEFSCDANYPATVPEMSSNIDQDIIDRVVEEAREFVSTPMMFDMIRLAIRKLEESSVGRDVGGKISVSYSIDDSDKITEEEFLAWKVRNKKIREVRSGITGKEIFLERKRSRDEVQDDDV